MEDKTLLKKLQKIYKKRKNRVLIGTFLIPISIVLFELSIFIILGVLEIDVHIGVFLMIISTILLGLGLYLTLYTPPIILE